ncbi:hypothetical protein FOA52_014463 [Chlamydomonas sp. UWO 241]|nr:hypothetical protein FOA52_014463 [Chlamydomonas sp. UWO 241]
MVGDRQLPVKLNSVVNAARYVPSTSASSLIVAVRVRPLLKNEGSKANSKGKIEDIMRVIDGRVVVVLDPDESKEYLDVVQNRTKEKRYTFDVAFNPDATNEDVYNGTIRDLVVGVLYGINTTVFAYGATGSGKTYTMVGSREDPGLMIMSLQSIFIERERLFADESFEVTCSYCEVYNEVIYDLLVKSSGPLELREDPELGVQIAGVKHIVVKSADEILDLLEEGNRRRKTEATDANAHSSRSHAVLEITIKRTPRNHYRVQQLRAKLSLVDLAGSERAADTNNAGQKLRDGANINRSLLALANCINALGKLAGSANKAASYVPYRNSKLTRLLKDGLSGNSRTAMVATVSAAGDQYHHSIGTLKYADRAKEIKTHVVQNVGTVESHISDYQRIIDNLQGEVQDLKIQLADRPSTGGPSSPHGNVDGGGDSQESQTLASIDVLVQEMNDNIEERINLQKALFEIEDANVCNKYELNQLDDFLEAGQGAASVKDITEARDRRADVLSVIKDNERERDKLKTEISGNEEDKAQVQGRIDSIARAKQSTGFLNLVSTFRLQAVRLQEVKFQMAVRDQVIGEQREVIANLWKILDKSGMGRERVLEIAKQAKYTWKWQATGWSPTCGRSLTRAEWNGSVCWRSQSRLWKILKKRGMGQERVLEIAKQEGIIMDGFFHETAFMSEASTRGPTPPFNSGGRGSAHGQQVGVWGSKAPAGMVLPGLAGAQVPHDVATPNAQLAGNRAKMRYRFWAAYDEESTADNNDDTGAAAAVGGSGAGGNPVARRNRQRSRKSVSEDEPSGTLRGASSVETQRGGAAAGRRTSIGDAGRAGGGRRSSIGAGGARGDPGGSAGSRGAGAASGRAGSGKAGGLGASTRPGAYRELLNGGAGAGVKDGAGAAGAGGHNSTVPPGGAARGAHAGRRAGLPPAPSSASAGGPSLELPSISGFAKQQLHHNVPTPDAPGQGLAPPAQAALNDRLARLKQRLGKRQTEESGQMPGLPGRGGKPGSAGEVKSPDAIDDFALARRS